MGPDKDIDDVDDDVSEDDDETVRWSRNYGIVAE
jgi:hypothetical protein